MSALGAVTRSRACWKRCKGKILRAADDPGLVVDSASAGIHCIANSESCVYVKDMGGHILSRMGTELEATRRGYLDLAA